MEEEVDKVQTGDPASHWRASGKHKERHKGIDTEIAMRRTENHRGTRIESGIDPTRDMKDTLTGNLRGSLLKMMELEEMIQDVNEINLL